jgi:hypothetical protein
MSAKGTCLAEGVQVPERSRFSVPRTTHVCLSCQQRRSLFRYRDAVKADADHTLCFQCFRALQDSVRARCLADRLSEFR